MREITELPEETREVVSRLLKKGYIESCDGKVSLTDDMAYVLLIVDRADIFD